MDSAREAAKAMLDPTRVGREPALVHGYIDVLAPQDSAPTGFSNAMMQLPALAAVYQKVWRPAFTRLFSLGGTGTLSYQEMLLDEFSGRGDQRILDVACGPGLYTKPLAAGLADDGLAIGLDFSDAMLRNAVRDNSGRRVAYVRASALELPFADGAFDTVVCLAALYLIPSPRRAVHEICRVVRPGGRIALFASLRTPVTALAGSRFAERISGFRWFGRDEITGWLHDEGLTEIQQTVFGQGQFITARQVEG